ncbi:hypothetical protein [Nannocystis sp. SCPEA4]|uniref:hypothetical protein n=1 Tax=Nannocystis sp. SCPEA4 TaxID=2996787 RepID=UPI002270FDAD|nr:hypothetical protein [Nannocystis sp. SCPEA4]MCY1060362.1 hypothetical protein [Nannocystis sp. SCPEA4]
MHLRALSFAFALVLVACSGDKGDSSTDTDTDTTGTGTTSPTDPTEGPLDPACSCLETDSCGAQICERVGLVCEEECGDEPTVDDEAALQCALEALRDRKPGRLSWYNIPSVTTTYNTRVYIQADGDAIVEESGGVDLCNYTGPDVRRKLKDPAYFADCLALAGSNERFTCMEDGFGEQVVECRPLNESCSEF